METETLIIGGGLSGLALAWQLHQQGREFHLLEARNRLGGRILSPEVSIGRETNRFDMGPAWFWNINPRMARYIDVLGLSYFEQYSQGELMFEDAQGRVHQGVGHASMQGSLRIEGGVQYLIKSLVKRLPEDKITLGAKVSRLSRGDHITAFFGDQTIKADKTVLALPPRIAAGSIAFDPGLPDEVMQAMMDIPTWMAGHAKFIAIYESPFWRNKGLSGDAMSRRGPMVEIHDASPQAGGPYALFGFLGTAIDVRKTHKMALLEACILQLASIFGPEAAKPAEILFQDWAYETETATALDHQPLTHHPQYGLPPSCQTLWDGKLLLGSTEIASQFGGYLEGALEAAETVLQQITNPSKAKPMKVSG